MDQKELGSPGNLKQQRLLLFRRLPFGLPFLPRLSALRSG